jgi:hypothetical protein
LGVGDGRVVRGVERVGQAEGAAVLEG